MTTDVQFYAEDDPAAVAPLAPRMRPAKIIWYFLKRQCKQKHINMHEAVEQFACMTHLSVDEVSLIVEGSPPTSSQLRSIMETLCWSPYFIMGISREAYMQREAVFFRRLSIRSPSAQERRSFQELYARLLRLKLEEQTTSAER